MHLLEKKMLLHLVEVKECWRWCWYEKQRSKIVVVVVALEGKFDDGARKEDPYVVTEARTASQ